MDRFHIAMSLSHVVLVGGAGSGRVIFASGGLSQMCYRDDEWECTCRQSTCANSLANRLGRPAKTQVSLFLLRTLPHSAAGLPQHLFVFVVFCNMSFPWISFFSSLVAFYLSFCFFLGFPFLSVTHKRKDKHIFTNFMELLATRNFNWVSGKSRRGEGGGGGGVCVRGREEGGGLFARLTL